MSGNNWEIEYVEQSVNSNEEIKLNQLHETQHITDVVPETPMSSDAEDERIHRFFHHPYENKSESTATSNSSTKRRRLEDANCEDAPANGIRFQEAQDPDAIDVEQSSPPASRPLEEKSREYLEWHMEMAEEEIVKQRKRARIWEEKYEAMRRILREMQEENADLKEKLYVRK